MPGHQGLEAAAGGGAVAVAAEPQLLPTQLGAPAPDQAQYATEPPQSHTRSNASDAVDPDAFTTEPSFAQASADKAESELAAWQARRDGLLQRRLGRKKKAGFFVSAPGATMSSEFRDASTQQGRFDLCSMLKTYVLCDEPAVIANLSTRQVLLTNQELDELFEMDGLGSNTGAIGSDLINMIHEDDHDRFWSVITYLEVSERADLEPMTTHIRTMLGNVRQVQVDGERLIQSWWKLRMTLRG